jgi:hypothetical protein
MRRRASFAAAATIAAFVAAGCSSTVPAPEGSVAATPTSEAPVVASPRPAGGPDEPSTRPEPAPILGFSAPLLAGGQLEGSSLEGRDVALWFWAPW